MATRHAWLGLVVLLAPAGARADNHWGDIRAAASASAGSALYGIDVSLTKTVPHIAPRVWNVVGDVNLQWGKHHLTQWSGFVGARRTLVHRPYLQTLPFVHVLIGLAQDHDRPSKTGAHGMLITGLGCDLVNDRQKKDGSYKETLIAWRVQLDWIASLSGNVNPYARLTGGIVFRFDENFKPLPMH